jgi:F0F1-type ATP synthase assembly protein I
MYVVMKIVASAIVIAIVSEVARRFPTYGGIIAALPLVSLLSIIWLHVQGEQTETLSKFALGVLWGFPATALLLFIVYLSLKNSIPLFLSIGFGVGGWLLFLFIQDFIVKFVRV